MVQRTVAQIIRPHLCPAWRQAGSMACPAGGSSLDLIRAFAECGIPFILTRTEAGAAMAAAASAETAGLGVVITTQGPGTACAVNGIAHASLDRCPVHHDQRWLDAGAAAFRHAPGL